MPLNTDLLKLIPKHLKPLLPLEEKLILCSQLGIVASDFQNGPIDMAQLGNAQNVRSEFLAWLLVAPAICKKIHYKGVQLRGARILDIFDLEDANVKQPLRLRNCIFEEKILLDRGKFYTLEFSGCQTKTISAASIRVTNDVFITNGFRSQGEVCFKGADIGGSLFCSLSEFENPNGVAINGDEITVKGSIFLTNWVRVKGEVRLLAANIGGSLICNNAVFENPEGYALSGDGLTTKGSIFLCSGFKAQGQIRLPRTNIGGDLVCENAEFTNPNSFALYGDGLTTTGAIYLRNGFKAKGEVRFLKANIGCDLDCSCAEFENPDGHAISCDGFTTKGNVNLLNGFMAKGQVRLPNTEIGGNLDCRGAVFINTNGDAFCGYNMKINGALVWRNLKKQIGGINLINAQIAFLEDDKDSWPETGNLYIDGLIYGPFTSYVPTDSKSRLEWLELRNLEDLSVQPYEQLTRIFYQMGLQDDARNVAIAKQRFVRKQKTGFSRFWSWILDITISYGYRPGKIILFLFCFFLLGAGVFAFAFNLGVMEPTANPATLLGNPKVFNPFGYSLDVLLPIVDLHQESAWQPNPGQPFGNYFQIYMYIQILMGWFFTTLAVAAVTGLVKSDY